MRSAGACGLRHGCEDGPLEVVCGCGGEVFVGAWVGEKVVERHVRQASGMPEHIAGKHAAVRVLAEGLRASAEHGHARTPSAATVDVGGLDEGPAPCFADTSLEASARSAPERR